MDTKTKKGSLESFIFLLIFFKKLLTISLMEKISSAKKKATTLKRKTFFPSLTMSFSIERTKLFLVRPFPFSESHFVPRTKRRKNLYRNNERRREKLLLWYFYHSHSFFSHLLTTHNLLKLAITMTTKF